MREIDLKKFDTSGLSPENTTIPALLLHSDQLFVPLRLDSVGVFFLFSITSSLVASLQPALAVSCRSGFWATLFDVKRIAVTLI